MAKLRILGLLTTLMATGCVVMTPSVPLTILQATSLVVSNAGALIPAAPGDAVVHPPYGKLKSVCIEINRDVSVADFVPALQAELALNGVDSQVYNLVPMTCHFAVYYTANVAWDQRIFSSDYMVYMTTSRIELRENGRVLAAASYQPSALNTSKWASTRDKIAPSVRVLVYGTSDGKPPKGAETEANASSSSASSQP